MRRQRARPERGLEDVQPARRLGGERDAAVVAARKNGKVSHLVAHVVSAGPREQSDFRCGLALKDALKARLPHYMIPKKVVFDEALPMTPNGKLDRRALTARENG